MGKLIDLVGKRFGRLIVIKRSYPNNKWNEIMWLCKCNCGKETIVNGCNLRSGMTRSCGCLKNEMTGALNRIDFGVASMRSLISAYKISARKRGVKYELTEEQFKEITQKDCYYCGVKPSNVFGHGSSNNGKYIYNGIDRVDNNKGYTMDNVVPCCKVCNFRKKTATLHEFKDWIRKVYNNLYKKKV